MTGNNLPAAAASPQPCEDEMLFCLGGMTIFPLYGSDGCITARFASYSMSALDELTGQFDQSKAIPRNIDDYQAEVKRCQCDVMAERERCAKIAEDHMSDCDGNGCGFIAAKIRSGE